MAFWNVEGSKDPKRNFRFKVMIEGLQGDEGLVWFAKKATKPNFTVAESKHSYLNHTYYWPGRVEWQTISVTFVDPVMVGGDQNNGTVQLLNKLMQESGYRPPDTQAALVTQSKANVASKLGFVQIVQIDAEGDPIEHWTLHNPFIKKISYGELDYENDDLTQIEVEFRYDYAICGTDNNVNPFFDAGVAGDQ